MNAKELGRKITSLFLLCRQLLSPQQHYDWGLRALKTILGVAGLLVLVRIGGLSGMRRFSKNAVDLRSLCVFRCVGREAEERWQGAAGGGRE